MFIVTLAIAAVRVGAEPRARTVTEPGQGTKESRSSMGISATRWFARPNRSSGSVTVGLYRNHSAAYWAWRFRQRTHQLQSARGRTNNLQRILATRLLQPAYGTATLEQAFLCIHRYEGSWTDPGSPFWGGLQMDSSFQSTYGSWALSAFGTADRWPVSVQIATAIRAYVSGRGFYPWPNTARSCGLL